MFNPLDGAWQSDRDLTLEELQREKTFSPQQWQLLSSPEFFGHMLYVFHRGSAITVFDGECSAPISYEVDTVSAKVRLASTGSNASAASLSLDRRRLHVPITLLPGGHRETFTRVDLEVARNRHPCVRAFLNQP